MRDKWHKFKTGMIKVMLLALTIIMVCPHAICAYDVDKYEIEWTQSKLAPESLLKFLERHSVNGKFSQSDVLRAEILDDYLSDPKTREEIFRYSRFPTMPKAIADSLNGFFEVKSKYFHSSAVISFNVSLGGNCADLYFFKDSNVVNLSNYMGLSKSEDVEIIKTRGYWINIIGPEPKKSGLSLKHKGTADDPLKVVFIMPRSPSQMEKPTRLPLGLMSMASCLRDKSFLFKLAGTLPHCRYYNEDDVPVVKPYIIDLQAEDAGFDLRKRLSEIDPDIVAVTAVTPLFNSAIRIGEIAAQTVPEAVRMLGGVHISAMGEDIEKIKDFFLVRLNTRLLLCGREKNWRQNFC